MKRHSFKERMKWAWVVLIGALFLLQTTASAIVHPFVVDQENINFSGGGNANAQEFTPTLDALDVVEVFIGPRDPATVAVVNIRIGSITGPIIGTSLPTGPTPGSQIVHFDFPSAVPLVPGDLYVYEVSFLSGGFAFVTGPNTYPGGRAIMSGVPQPDLDSSFREGLSSDLPSDVLDHFLCYKVKKNEKFEQREVSVRNQFGEQTFIVLEPDTLCVPSSKKVRSR